MTSQLRPILKEIATLKPSLRIELKRDPMWKGKVGVARMRIELWTPFLHVRAVPNHPRLFEFDDTQSSFQIAWFMEDESGVYLCSHSPLVRSQKVSVENIDELLTVLRKNSNWSVPW